jgi:glutaredoxin
MTIKIYNITSSDGENCENLCQKLDAQGTEYELIDDTKELFKILRKTGLDSIPVVWIDGHYFTYSQALKMLVVKR